MNRTVTRILPFALALALLIPFPSCGSSVKAQRYDDMVSMYDTHREIWVESEAIAACGLEHSPSYFEYNSSEIKYEDRVFLGRVGRCFSSGRLAGRSVLVTGFTDRDGTADYNFELGMARSRAVATELVAQGMLATRVYVRSQGQARATGDTQAGRALDRKVEIHVLQHRN